MFTLTFRDTFRSRMLMAAQASVGGQAWAELSSEQRSAALAAEAQPYATLWLKRVRAESGAAFRYLMVTELHEDGMPHLHGLLHEGQVQIRHRCLSRQWIYGYSNVKLVEEGEAAARYVTKYVSKSPVSRVRASVGYGHDGDNASLDIGR